MKLKLTEAVLKSLALGPTRAFVWDTKTVGFGVVVGATSKVFVVRAYVNGERRRVTLGEWPATSLDAARSAAETALGQMHSGVNPNAEKKRAEGPTLRKALELHLEKMERGENRRRKACSPGSIETLKTTVEYHLADALDEPLLDLTPDALEKIVKRIETAAAGKSHKLGANPRGRATGVRLLANVSAIWNTWEKRHGLPVPNPTKRLTPAALKPRDERIANEALPTWYATVQTLPAIRRDLQLVSIFTGIREDGLRHLRHEDVDLAAGLLHVTHAKGDKPYTLPLTQTLRDIFERRKRDNEDQNSDTGKWLSPYAEDGGRADHGWVFPSISRDGERVIPIAETKQRIPNPKYNPDEPDGEPATIALIPGTHANRRTYNSVATEIGVLKEYREALLNHEDRGVNVRHYGRPQTWDHLAAQAALVEAAMWARLTPNAPRPQGAVNAR